MTALTTILGMSTMALATGMGAEMMQPMAVVIVGGLAYSTLMTLFVVPVLYDIFNGEKMKAREIEMMKEAAGMAREGFESDAALLPETNRAETASPEPAPEPEQTVPAQPAAEAAPEPMHAAAAEPVPAAMNAPAQPQAAAGHRPVPTPPVKRTPPVPVMRRSPAPAHPGSGPNSPRKRRVKIRF